MGKRYLLDTNIIVYFIGGVLPTKAQHFINKVLLHPPYVSIISKIELLGWHRLQGSNTDNINTFLKSATIYGLDEIVADSTIYFRKNYRKTKLPDAIIAATCLSYNLDLITRNVADFAMMKELRTINPFEL